MYGICLHLLDLPHLLFRPTLTKATLPLDDRGSCNRDSRGHHSTTCDRANERRVHPSSPESTHSEDFQTKREGGWGGPTGCMFVAPNQPHFRGRKAAGSSVTLCAGRGGGDHRISPRSLDVGFSSDELTPCSASKGPLCFPLMDGSSRAATSCCATALCSPYA